MTQKAQQGEKSTNDNDQLHDPLSKFWKFCYDNPAFVLSLFYVYVTAMGILYSVVLYGTFGINIFDYAETADFLFAAFKNPETRRSVLLTLGSVIILFALLRAVRGS